MCLAKDVKFSLKVMINRQKTKVLFVEANGDFVDVLLSFLTMPVWKAVKVLEKHYGSEAPVIGSLNTLYKGLVNLDSVHFWTEAGKQFLLNPRSCFESECRRLKLDIADTPPPEWLACEKCRNYITSIYCDYGRCTCCGSLMGKQIVGTEIEAAGSDGGVFVENTASFIISDDLQIVPDMTDVIQIFSILGITETDWTELDNITIGFSEIMDLFKASLFSPTPLSDIILARKTHLNLANVKSEPGSSLPSQEMNPTSGVKILMKVILKVIVQKSNNKLLYARAREDFVDFLTGFLTIPLGKIVSLLDRRTCFTSIDNLYRSVVNLTDYKVLKTPDMRTRLREMTLPHGSISRNQILPLAENHLPTNFYPFDYDPEYSSVNFPEGQGNYMKGPRTYTITDDLTITPFCISSIVSTLKGLKLTTTDIKEVELGIGLQEGLRILKASLTSSCVLSDALTVYLVPEKQPKQFDT